MSTQQNAFPYDEQFSYEDGLGFAVGFTAYDNEEEPILDKSIGKLVFNAYNWGVREDNTYFSELAPIETHPCTDEELGLTGLSANGTLPGDVQFLPIRGQNQNELKTFRRKMQCVDKSEMYISGDYSSASARLMNIQLIKCHGHDYCASDEEIKAFLRDKYLIILYN